MCSSSHKKKRFQRGRRTEDELRELARFVNYEWEMLNRTADLALEEWGRFGHPPEQSYAVHDATHNNEGYGVSGTHNVVASAFLESFLIHARVLMDFFFPPQSVHKDDFFACEYLQSQAGWEKGQPTPCTYLEGERTRLNKCLAHLSDTRPAYTATLDAKRWEVETVLDELSQVWEQFLTALSPPRQNWFQKEPKHYEG